MYQIHDTALTKSSSRSHPFANRLIGVQRRPTEGKRTARIRPWSIGTGRMDDSSHSTTTTTTTTITTNQAQRRHTHNMIARLLGATRRKIHPPLTTTTGTGIPRSFSSSGGKKSTTSRDTRLAGRLRFYKEVGVQAVPAPWEESSSSSSSSSSSADAVVTQSSPISAGVDGTDSASGVHRRPSSAADGNHPSGDSFQSLLTPRAPGTASNETSKQQIISWHGVTLDGRILKTPMGQTLAVPSELLAHMIAAEWGNQKKYLQPVNMPLMTLACTTLDQAAFHPQVYRDESLRYLPTDTTCFWADLTEDRVLYRRQEEAWKELHQFVQDRWDHAPAFAMGANEAILMARKRGDAKPTTGLPHPPQLQQQFSDWTHSLDAWHLVALSSICSQAKSFLVAWAMMEPNSPIRDLQRAIDASRVEEEFQISNWGLVEGGHDYDRLNHSIQLHSAQLFVKTIAIDNELK